MKVKLDSLDPFHPQYHVILNEETIVIGRDRKAHVELRDRWVSRRHCTIHQENGTLIVQDLKSKHGTLVNGERVKRSPLLPGDVLTIGIRTFRVSYRRPVGSTKTHQGKEVEHIGPKPQAE